MSKFKNAEELEKAYKELEKEFTKKSQKLAEVEKTNYVTLLHNEMDSLLDEYAKRRIADLEAKLASSEKDKQFYFFENGEKGLKIRELKQQLAEKDVELEDLRKIREGFLRLKEQKPNEFELLNLRDDVEGLLKELAEKNKEIENYKKCKCLDCKNETIYMLERSIQELEQDKISFCIEQLEKVKEEAKHYGYDFSKSMHEFVDKQIEELKKGNK